MHETKLTELQTALTTLKDAQLKLVVAKAIPLVKMHRDMLKRNANANTNSGNKTNTGNNRNSQ
jgi:hypothetical protein